MSSEFKFPMRPSKATADKIVLQFRKETVRKREDCK